ncbi:MAG: hypothetical protein LBR17_00230 [Bacteroidales bacterium]|jgi:hypothetical protein|nr:hypothetical protein [Bacteroidales bacterium]
MKKITLSVLFASLSMICFGQTIEMKTNLVRWNDKYKIDNGTRYDYIGTIEEEDFYAFGYYTTTGFQARFNRLGFMKVKDGKVLLYNEDYIKIPRNSLEHVLTTETDIAVIYNNEDDDRDMYQLRCKKIDKNTLKEKTDNVLLEFEKRKNSEQSLMVIPSKNKGNYALLLFASEKKSDKASLRTFYFDRNFELLWQHQYITEQEKVIAPLNVLPNESGSIYVISKVMQEEFYNKKRRNDKEEEYTSFVIAKLSENNMEEHLIEGKFPCREAEMYEIKSNEIFIACGNRKQFSGITFDISQENIINTSSFEYKLDKEETFWSISQILPLKNENLVVVVEDNYTLITTSTSVPTSYNYCGRNFYTLCVNPYNNNKPLYNQMVSRAIGNFSQWKSGGGQYEKPMFFTKGNDLYAIYNADIRDNDYSGEVFTDVNIDVMRSARNVVTNMLHLNETGEAKIVSIFSYKDSDLLFSANISHLRSDGILQIGSIVKKVAVFGELNPNEN